MDITGRQLFSLTQDFLSYSYNQIALSNKKEQVAHTHKNMDESLGHNVEQKKVVIKSIWCMILNLSA